MATLAQVAEQIFEPHIHAFAPVRECGTKVQRCILCNQLECDHEISHTETRHYHGQAHDHDDSFDQKVRVCDVCGEESVQLVESNSWNLIDELPF